MKDRTRNARRASGRRWKRGRRGLAQQAFVIEGLLLEVMLFRNEADFTGAPRYTVAEGDAYLARRARELFVSHQMWFPREDERP